MILQAVGNMLDTVNAASPAMTMIALVAIHSLVHMALHASYLTQFVFGQDRLLNVSFMHHRLVEHQECLLHHRLTV